MRVHVVEARGTPAREFVGGEGGDRARVLGPESPPTFEALAVEECPEAGGRNVGIEEGGDAGGALVDVSAPRDRREKGDAEREQRAEEDREARGTLV